MPFEWQDKTPLIVDRTLLEGLRILEPDGEISYPSSSPGFQAGESIVEALGKVSLNSSEAANQLEMLIDWHENRMTLVEMAVRLVDASGTSVWDRMTSDEQVILSRISHNEDQSDLIRGRTLEVLRKLKATGLANVSRWDDRSGGQWLLPIRCEIKNPARAIVTVTEDPDDPSKVVLRGGA